MTNFVQFISSNLRTMKVREKKKRKREVMKERERLRAILNTMNIFSYVPFNYHLVRLPLRQKTFIFTFKVHGQPKESHLGTIWK